MAEYDPYNVNDQGSERTEYIVAKILKGFFAVITLVVKIMVEVLKGVLAVFKIPVPKY